MPVLSAPRPTPGTGQVITDSAATAQAGPRSQQGRAGELSWRARAARQLVLRQLDQLPHARIAWHEAGETTLLGQGHRVAGELIVEDPRLYAHVLMHGSVGFGEAFVDRWWTTPDLLNLLRTLAGSTPSSSRGSWWGRAIGWGPKQLLRWARQNTRAGSRRNISAHYDLSNEFFAAFLDPTMTYSSGLFESDGATLHDASLAKYERICRRLDLQSDDHVVEIGCGWGGFAEYAAANYGCRVTGVTISREQLAYAQQRIERAGLSHRVDLRFCDYRDLTGKYDKLVSIEMIEAVGRRFLPQFFAKCSELLRPHGQMMLQAITIPDQRFDAYCRNVDFIQKHVFPGGCLPSLGAIQTAVGERTDLRLLETVDFAEDYARTLVAWRERFHGAAERIAQLGFDERFMRLWDYYLCYCAAGFYERQIGLAHQHFAKPAAR